MDTPVQFSFVNWAARYPELAQVGQPTAQAMFNEAQLYCDNTTTSIIPNCAPAYPRTTFLNMLTAHLVALNSALNGTPSSPLVGRISNATEGSVTVATQNDYPPGSAQWFQQSKYGAAFWAATAQYRTMHYVPGPRGLGNPWGLFGRY